MVNKHKLKLEKVILSRVIILQNFYEILILIFSKFKY